MPRVPDEHFLDIWREAAEEPIGLLIRTNNQIKARARFYAVRRAAPEGALGPKADDLELRLGADDGELVLVHTKAAIPRGLPPDHPDQEENEND